MLWKQKTVFDGSNDPIYIGWHLRDSWECTDSLRYYCLGLYGQQVQRSRLHSLNLADWHEVDRNFSNASIAPLHPNPV